MRGRASIELADITSQAPAPCAPDPKRVSAAARALMDALGFDRDDPHLRETDERMARSLLEMFEGCYTDVPLLKTFPNEPASTGPVVVRHLPVYSTCAHHLLPFFGTVEIAYLPGQRLVGLSKLGRAIQHVARRPQVQERLTEQLADVLCDALRPRGLLVVVKARHLCMEMRGIRTAGAITQTCALRGEYADTVRYPNPTTLIPRDD